MTKFWVKLLVFMLPVVAVLAYFEYRLAHIPNSYNRKRDFLEAQLPTITVLQLGSSQACTDIDPAYFCAPGFNLSNVSQSHYYDARLTAKYIDRMTNLKLIIISICYTSFQSQLNQSTEAWREFFYERCWDIPTREATFWKPEAYFYWFLYGHKTSVESVIKRFDVDFAKGLQPNGCWLESKKEIGDATGKMRADLQTRIMHPDNIDINCGYIRELLAMARERNIKVVFIQPPAYTTYLKYLDSNIVKSNNVLAEKLSREGNTHYYDYLADSRFTIDDYNNDNHLNLQGNIKFSKLLDSEIVKPYLGFRQVNLDSSH